MNGTVQCLVQVSGRSWSIWCTVLCGSDRPARRTDSSSFLILPPNPINLNKPITETKPPNPFIVFMCMWQKGKYTPQYLCGGERMLFLESVSSNLTWVLGLKLRSPGRHCKHLPMLSHLPSTAGGFLAQNDIVSKSS